MLLLRLNSLAQGYSGASPHLLTQLQKLLNSNCVPLIPRKGSVGASGDLAPLAHIGLLVLGIGDAYIGHEAASAAHALKHANLSPLTLGLRDGLALINGTQAMSSVAIKALRESNHLIMLADLVAATSLDAIGGHATAFDARIHQIKPHPGQKTSAQLVEHAIRERHTTDAIKNIRTQDPYSLRCVPQVHGATRDVITHVTAIVEREINSVTDNPLFFVKDDDIDILSGGNFHGQHLALALDYLAMAVAELANIAERRLELLLNPIHSNGLPAFLIDNSGLNSGYMMLHVTATALVNENKVLSHPASTDSIPTSANREDHVSMGMTSANKLCQVIENTQAVLAIECLASHQALDFRPKNMAGLGVRDFHSAFREHVPFRSRDGLYKDDLAKTLSWLALPETRIRIREILMYN
jgi:histidine ammonia-lyase